MYKHATCQFSMGFSKVAEIIADSLDDAKESTDRNCWKIEVNCFH